MKKIVYNIDSGFIVGHIPKTFEIEDFYYHFPNEIRSKLATIDYSGVIDFDKHMIKGGELYEFTDIEVSEMYNYGYILTEEERLLNQLKPSQEEIQKAEETLKLLELLQEVI